MVDKKCMRISLECKKKEAVTEEANTENRNDNLVKVHSEKCTVSIPHKATDCQAKGEEK